MKGWAKVARDIAEKCCAIHPLWRWILFSNSTHRPLVLHLLDDTPINVLQADAERDLVTLHFRPTPHVCKSNHDYSSSSYNILKFLLSPG